MRGLLLLAVASLAFSSTSIAALGLEDVRMVLFAGVMAALAIGATLIRPVFAVRDRAAPLFALWLVALIALTSAVAGEESSGSLVDYKIVLPIIALLLAGNLRAAMGGLDLPRFALNAGAVYVLATTALALALPTVATLRNVAAHVRLDITGSVVLHASLCMIVALITAAALARRGDGRSPGAMHRIFLVVVLAAAAWMVMVTGTRSPLLALGFFVVLWLVSGRLGDLARPKVLGLAIVAALLFALLTIVAGDTLWSRLIDLGRADYTSGRWPAIRHWLALAAGEPFGLGMGATRHLLAEGRPIIAGGHLLEWPHNELVRFHVEGGVFGVTLVLVVMGDALRRAVRRARTTPDPLERVLLLAIAADMLAQCLFQNYFNGVYHATVMLMFIGMLAADDESSAERR